MPTALTSRPTLPAELVKGLCSFTSHTPVASAVGTPMGRFFLRSGAKVSAWMSRLSCRAPAGERETT
jgi:hypothetical protein